jgi:branched-chain amino acid transport system ATP-binding protein
MPTEGLVAEQITVQYGGVLANDRVSICVEPGQVVGLIGPNGAGKTSFIDALSGFTPAEGKISLSGTRLDGLSPHRRRRLGLGRTWQAGELFDSLTVLENVLVAERGVGFRTVLRDLGIGRKLDPRPAMAVLDRLGLAEFSDKRPGELPLGMQRVVGVARAMAGASKVLLLDEPAAGLDTEESHEFGNRLKDLARSGYGTLLVDHDIDLVFQACSQIYVLDFGRIIASGPADKVRTDPLVLEAYLGADASTAVEG